EVSAPATMAALADASKVLAKMGYKKAPELALCSAAQWEETNRRAALVAALLLNFVHNSKTAESEPQWSSVDKTALPDMAFADRPDRSYPHHFVENGGKPDDKGRYTTGTLYLHKGGLNAAWAAAMGAHTGEKASPAVIAHLEAHRKALGLTE